MATHSGLDSWGLNGRGGDVLRPTQHPYNGYQQWRTEGGGLGCSNPPEILKAFQNCAKLNPICENC